ncbi:MAG: L-serine ammonia-lyase, iron-sulfur-dependent, subunit alpha [Coriobacteriaceae bacterium]|nr:L-serine ammonia-lyase, iron-sulfur-dependent, subunit alpha [Coriobacteriaceae bacterium]
MDRGLMDAYTQILREELVCAMGCTEPIAIAYAAALARETLGCLPASVDLAVSPNIIKNVKSVVVPHTGGLKGMAAAASAGIVAGDAAAELEVLAKISPDDLPAVSEFLETAPFTLEPTSGEPVLDIRVRVEGSGHSASVRIAGTHTNVVRVERDGEVLVDRPVEQEGGGEQTDRSVLSIEGIVEYADTVDVGEVAEVLERQISCNTAIADAGFTEHWGAGIGRVLMDAYGGTVHNRAKAAAAAGSDARMSGCELPVVINSGSGNQGITASLPVIVFAREMGISHELLLRALVVSNLTTIHLKTGIGRLSAYCGATSAGCGAGAGICYLHGGKVDEIAHTVVNAVAINSGMICDGAKPSCAAKIASAVEAGLLGWQMQVRGEEFFGGDGIVVKGVENTIEAVGRLARDGMRQTDEEIIRLMIGSSTR